MADTVLSRIIRLVQQAQGSKAPIQRLADRIAAVFVPVVMGIAAVTFVVWLVVGPEPAYLHALVSAVTVLIIACPCAMGLAVPTAVMVATGRGAELGILIKGGEALERSSRLDTVVFDKTGTVTEGRPTVQRIAGEDEAEALRLAASLERHSEHPLGEAIVAAGAARGLALAEPRQFESLTGRGVTASWRGGGWPSAMPRCSPGSASSPGRFAAEAEAFAAEAHTAVFVAVDGAVVAVIAHGRRGKAGRAGGRRGAAAHGSRERDADGRQRPDGGGHRARRGHRPGASPTCFPRASSRRSGDCSRTGGRSRWSATGSTTRRRWPRRTWASRWAPAPTWRSRRATSR